MTDLATELRIIATEAGRLDPGDRAKIAEMVEHFEWLQDELTRTRAALFEETARRIAASERLTQLQPKPALPMSMSSGWLSFTPNKVLS